MDEKRDYAKKHLGDHQLNSLTEADLCILARNLQEQLIIDGHTEDCACVQGASVDCTCGRRDFEGNILPRESGDFGLPEEFLIIFPDRGLLRTDLGLVYAITQFVPSVIKRAFRGRLDYSWAGELTDTMGAKWHALKIRVRSEQ